MFYDTFSSEYDRFVNWPGRLQVELPFLQEQLDQAGARRLLDSACGTGMHGIALAQAGFDVSGADLSIGMIEQARLNATQAELALRFEPAGFGELVASFGAQGFDALLCLGNSLPHLLTPQALTAALDDFALCLKPGGLLLIQNRNFDAVMANRQRWMEPQSAREGTREWLFQRFYDFEPDGLLTFNILTLHRDGNAPWTQSVRSIPLRPLLAAELYALLPASGFHSIALYGDMTGSSFDPALSSNLVLTARR